jgi:hypothetical protein
VPLIKMKGNQLTEPQSDPDIQEDPEDGLRVRLERLERESQEHRRQTEQRMILAELKVEAMRADMIDLDGLQFLDLTQAHLDEDGGVTGGTELISRLKRAKPWLFSAPSSSSVAKVPPSSPARQRLAKDMSDEEYRSARANIIKRSAL